MIRRVVAADEHKATCLFLRDWQLFALQNFMAGADRWWTDMAEDDLNSERPDICIRDDRWPVLHAETDFRRQMCGRWNNMTTNQGSNCWQGRIRHWLLAGKIPSRGDENADTAAWYSIFSRRFSQTSWFRRCWNMLHGRQQVADCIAAERRPDATTRWRSTGTWRWLCLLPRRWQREASGSNIARQGSLGVVGRRRR
jgi:hypothetical protein